MKCVKVIMKSVEVTMNNLKEQQRKREVSICYVHFDRLLRQGNRLCRTRINPMTQEVIQKVESIYRLGMHDLLTIAPHQGQNNPLIIASQQGHVDMVWGFIECAKQTNTNLYNRNSGEFQEFLWLRNGLDETALDVAIKEGHVEMAKLLLENASLECLISKRNHEGKLPVSMLDDQHDMFIWSTLEKATTATVDPSTLIWIGEENLKQDLKVYTDSIMHPKSYPQSHKHELRDSLEKLDQGTLELTPNKNTILHLVSQKGEIKYAHDILVKHPSLVYHRNSEGETPAYVAAREGHVEILAIMISYFKTKNDDIESLLIRSIDNHTALHIAIQNHHVGVVFWLIKEIPQLVNIINDFNETPIYLAAERGYDHLLNQMLNKCQRKSFKGPKGKTELHAAAISGSRECIEYLLREKIDQKICDEHGWTPLRYAVLHNNASATAELVDANPSVVYEMIKEDDINTSVIHIAARRGYCETLKVLMSHCPGSSELVDEKGRNIFHVAVLNKQTEVIKLIHHHDTYTTLVNKNDNEGNTPIHLLMASDLEMMDLVMDSRVNINALNNEKLTPLDMASSNDKPKGMLEGIAMGKKVDRPTLSDIDIDHKNTRGEDASKSLENYLIVATLIATASFAATFTVPGGFNGNEGSKQGMPILLRKAAFQAFMVTNTLAFSFSSSVLYKHLMLLVTKPDANRIRRTHKKMHFLTGYAMMAMIVAFATGTYVVLTPYHGFAIFLCALTILSPYLMFSISDLDMVDSFLMGGEGRPWDGRVAQPLRASNEQGTSKVLVL